MAANAVSIAHAPQGRRSLAYVVNSLNPGGTERLVVEMARNFARDFKVGIACLDEEGAWADEARAAGADVICLGRKPGFDGALPGRLAGFLRASSADIVHAHQCTPWFYSALARMSYARPRLLFEEHGRFHPEIPSRKRVLVNKLLIRRLTHRFVAVSEDIRARLERYEGLDPAHIEVVYNGVRTATALEATERATLRRSLGLSAEAFVVGTVGRFDPIKNLPLLVRALAIAARERPQVQGLLVGDGPAADVRALAHEAGLSDRVHFTGFRSDARSLVQCMDLFVLPSFSEGTSMALLEALAAGVPVAVTAVGGNPEIVRHDSSGWIVPSDATEELAAAIVDAADHPQKRHAFALAGRALFEERFSFDRMIAAYTGIYRQMLGEAA